MSKIYKMLQFSALVTGMFFLSLTAVVQGQTTDAAFGDKLQNFRDWQGVCQEDTSCSASVFSPADTSSDTADYAFRASRDGGELTPLVLSFSAITHLPAKGEILNLRIIGGPAFALAQGAGYEVSDDGFEFFLSDKSMLGDLYPAMKQGSSMSVSFRDGRGEIRVAEFSLRGLSAAVTWMNSEQQRNEKSTRVGPPVRSAAKPEAGDDLNVAPLALPPGVMALQSQVEACARWAGRPASEAASKRYDLGDGVNIYLVPCTAGNTNPASRVYIVQKGGAVDALLFARFSKETGWGGTDRLVNASFDKESGILSSRVKTQGLDGCGVLGVWLWRDGVFSMLRYAAWDDCENARAPEDWQVVYQPTAQ